MLSVAERQQCGTEQLTHDNRGCCWAALTSEARRGLAGDVESDRGRKLLRVSRYTPLPGRNQLECGGMYSMREEQT
jgi:hypothetical protein